MADQTQNQQTQTQTNSAAGGEQQKETIVTGGGDSAAGGKGPDGQAGKDGDKGGGDNGQGGQGLDYKDLALPDGTLLDTQHLEGIKEFAKANKLPVEAAKAILERDHKVALGAQQVQKEQFNQHINSWKQATEADKEIGGQFLKENAEHARRAVGRFGSEAFKQMLVETGLGNHPEIVRAFAKIGKSMKDDEMILGGASGGETKKDIGALFFPNSPRKK